MFKILATADETGNIKETICSRGTDTSKKDGIQPESVTNLLQTSEVTNVKNRIVDLKVLDRWIIATRLGGCVSIYDNYGASEVPEENYKLSHSYNLPTESNDKPVALVTFEESDFIMVAFESSVVYVIYLNNGLFDFEPIPVTLPARQDKNASTLSAFVANPYSRGIFATGGKDNDLQVLKLFGKNKKFSSLDFKSAKSWAPKILFQAENVEPDHLGLDVPIWISKILFCEAAPKKGFRLVTATRHGHIRKYDTEEDEEPIATYKVCEKPIISLIFATQAQDEIIICDTHTFVARLSLTKVDAKAQRIVSASAGTFYKPSLKLLGKYSEGGNTGAVHGIDASLETGVVAMGGLDRYLRVFDIQSRALVLKVYLGTQINAVTIILSTEVEDEEKKREVEEEEEFWNELDEKKETSTIQKKKRRI